MLSRFVIDSRKVKAGDTFVATKSDGSDFYRGSDDREYKEPYKFDSHPYINAAIANGATTVIYSDPRYVPDVDNNVRFMLVEDTVQYLADMMQEQIIKSNKTVIGITGSTGKSTACELTMKAVGANNTYKHLSDRPTPISIPVRALNDTSFYNVEFVVIEMPMDGLGQITELCNITKPDIGVLLNINDSHIKQLGSISNIVKAKMELIDYVNSRKGVVILNIDNPYLMTEIAHLKRIGANVITFGSSNNADFQIVSTAWNVVGYEYVIEYNDQLVTVPTKFIGKNLSYSLAAAVATSVASGNSFQDAMQNLNHVAPLPGRMSPLIGLAGELILDDTRLATPQSTHELIRLALSIPARRKILIQGPILRDYQHGNVKQETFSLMKQFDIVQLYSDKGWVPESEEFPFLENEKDLLDWYHKTIKAGDLVVFNGSEGVQMWKLVGLLVQPDQIGNVYDPSKHD